MGLEPVTQRAFDTALFQWARSPKGRRVIVEGESRRVGSVQIPDFIWYAMGRGTHWRVKCPAWLRAQRLVKEYTQPGWRHQLGERLQSLSTRLSTELRTKILQRFEVGDDLQVAALLLEHYYDPRYKHSSKHLDYEGTINFEDLDAACEQVQGMITADSPQDNPTQKKPPTR